MLTMAKITTLLLVLGSASAFGPFTPVTMHNVASNGGGMTMRVGTKDLIRRQRFNNILQSLQPNPTKESVEAVIVSDGTSALIEKVRNCWFAETNVDTVVFLSSFLLHLYVIVQLEVAQVHDSQGNQSSQQVWY